MSIADQFKGLPMESLIGGPLKAACEANVLMARATSNFINDVGFNKKDDGNGNLIAGEPRMVDFSFEKPGKDAENNPTIELVKIKVPILAIVPIPNLQINTVDVTFDMEVKNSTSAKDSKSASASLEASASGGFGPVSFDVKISGSVSTASENIRSSDNSAKYHVEIHAQNFGLPEGLARILDMMNQAVAPRQIEQYKVNEKGEKTGEPVIVDAEGEQIEVAA